MKKANRLFACVNASVMNAHAERVCAHGAILSKCVASLRVKSDENPLNVVTEPTVWVAKCHRTNVFRRAVALAPTRW